MLNFRNSEPLGVTNQFSQVFIEGNEHDLLIYVYLKDFSKKFASKVLNYYVRKYKDKNFKSLYMTFWDRHIAGDYLGYYKDNSSNFDIVKPLVGTRILKAQYDFGYSSKRFDEIMVIN